MTLGAPPVNHKSEKRFLPGALLPKTEYLKYTQSDYRDIGVDTPVRILIGGKNH
jgi:hypothetical protein